MQETKGTVMRICLVKPGLFEGRTRDAMPPLVFAIIKPLTPTGVSLSFYDENIETAPMEGRFDAVAISIDTFTARRGYLLADDFRRRGVTVIMGGIHATLCPDEAGEHADAVVVGEAEDTWGEVVGDLREGRLNPRYVSMNNTDLGGIKYDYSVFNGKKYNPVWIVQFSRGCRFSCDFCSVHALYGSSVRTRPAAAVADTLGGLPGKLIFFADDNLFSDFGRLDELLAAIGPLRRRWVCQISMDAAGDMDLLRRLRRSGCRMVIMGFESLDAENLRQMNKGANLSSDYGRAIDNIRRAGLMIYGTFVIGYDSDTFGTALELAAFARKNNFAIANFNPLIPTPGSGLYGRLKSEGRLLHERWWDLPGYRYGDTVFRPAGMSPEELAESCRRARYSFYSFRGIISRMRGVNIRCMFNSGLYLLSNIVSGLSIRQKQGRRLGK